MTKKKLLFIVNPNSGKNAVKGRLFKILDLFSKANYDIRIFISQKPREIIDYVSENAADFDLIVTNGGDGTLNETLNGMMNASRIPALGYIPTGTVNDFAAGHGISKNIDKAVATILAGNGDYFDVGKINGKYFSYICAFGAFTDVAYKTPQASKATFGKLAYYSAGVSQLLHLPAFKIRIEANGEVIEDEFTYGMITNSKSVGGFKIIEKGKAHLNDGLFEATFVKRPNDLKHLQATVDNLLKPTKRKCDDVIRIQAESFKITSFEPIEWITDGEFCGNFQEVDIQCKHNALYLLSGEELNLDKTGEKENENLQ